jgi:hypothetical protein
LATLGANGYPTADKAASVCDWKEGTSTQVPFRMCTYDRAADTQVSAYIHKEGHWNGWKKEVFERMLPVLQPVGGGLAAAAATGAGAGGAGAGGAVDPFPERTLVIDVGANIGFYTLLFATRGYDVLAVEPSRESVSRLLFSLEGNGVRAARSGSEVGLSAGKPLLRSAAGGGSNGDGSATGPKSAVGAAPQRSGRQPIVYVYQNAASDLYSSAFLQYIADNPGASSVVADAQPQAVTTSESRVLSVLLGAVRATVSCALGAARCCEGHGRWCCDAAGVVSAPAAGVVGCSGRCCRAGGCDGSSAALI